MTAPCVHTSILPVCPVLCLILFLSPLSVMYYIKIFHIDSFICYQSPGEKKKKNTQRNPSHCQSSLTPLSHSI